jgi:hypothetical protein
LIAFVKPAPCSKTAQIECKRAHDANPMPFAETKKAKPNFEKKVRFVKIYL